MAIAKILRVYLDDETRARADGGTFNLFNKIRAAFESQGFRVETRRNTESERLKSAQRQGYSLFHMDDPFHPRALTLRKAYYYPFWRIEASAKRWEWDIARQVFRPENIDARLADRFCKFWRKRLFGIDAPPAGVGGMVYVPLQGRLLQQRSFQTISPLAMIETVLQRDPGRDVVVGFHPGETYLAEETEAVRQLARRAPKLTISTDPMTGLLRDCDYVVTENSSVALAGYFFHKPALLFAQIDFHHIAAYAPETGIDRAVAEAQSLTPAYDKYLCWFLKLTAINGGSDKAEQQILDAVRRHGWAV